MLLEPTCGRDSLPAEYLLDRILNGNRREGVLIAAGSWIGTTERNARLLRFFADRLPGVHRLPLHPLQLENYDSRIPNNAVPSEERLHVCCMLNVA